MKNNFFDEIGLPYDPSKDHKPFNQWDASDYDKAASAVRKEMNMTSVEWGIIRYAIRKAVEENSQQAIE